MSAFRPTCKALASLFLAPCLALADGWSEDIWPSQETPRQGYRQIAECYTAVVERCRVAGLSEPSAPAWYRSTRGNLAELKTHLLPAIPRYARTNDCSITPPALEPYFNATNGSSTVIPYWSATGLLSFLRMPTNYFAFTPYRSLSGLGGDTSDPTVPYPHGSVNSDTAAGGTNYPAGRTNWYTTDYGYAGLPDILNSLRWTTNTASATGTAYAGISWTNVSDAASYDIAKTDCTNQWTTTNYPGPGVWNYRSVGQYAIKGTPMGYGAMACGQVWQCIATGISTVYVHQVEFYAYTTYPTLRGSETRVYTNWGDNATYDKFKYMGGAASTTNSTCISTTTGSANIHDAWPTWAECNTGNGYVYGYSHTAYRALIRWDVAGGFVFH
jgi:hypothetical protein